MAGIAALAVAYVLSQFFRSFLAVLTPVLSDELGATKGDLSVASGAWFAAFALMQFIVGVALDRFGPRRTAVFLLAIAGGGGAALFAAATAPWMVSVAMALIGIGCSPVLMATLYIFAKTYSPRRFALLSSWFIAVGLAGNVVGASPLAYAAEWWGWRQVMAGLAAITVVTSAAIYVLIRDPERSADQDAGRDGFRGYIELVRLRVLWPLMPLMLIGYATLAVIRGLWTGPYLADVYGADTVDIGHATLWMALAMIVGTFLYGPLDTIFKTRKWVNFVGGICLASSITFLAMAPEMPLSQAVVVLVAIGFFGTNFAVLMAHARGFFPAHLVGRGVTLMNFFGIGGVGLLQFASGILVTRAEASYSVSGTYQLLFGFYALLLAVALLIYLFSTDSKPDAA